MEIAEWNSTTGSPFFLFPLFGQVHFSVLGVPLIKCTLVKSALFAQFILLGKLITYIWIDLDLSYIPQYYVKE